MHWQTLGHAAAVGSSTVTSTASSSTHRMRMMSSVVTMLL